MKKFKNIYLISALAVGVASCSTEAPFSEDKLDGEGRLLTSAIAVELKTEENLVRAASAEPDVNDFTVDFLNAENPGDPVRSFRYGDMPEVVTLPVGDYIARAYYGGEYGSSESTAAFSAPYFKGESARFSIVENKITDNIGTVECSLANVKVTILFDEKLVDVMDANSTVTVRVGEKGSLSFTKDTEESGYFHYDEGSNTISAEFSGVVDGDDTTESKSYNNVQPGNHYRITFKLHSIDPNEPGEITPGKPGEEIKIDATVKLEDLTGEGGIDVNPSDEDIYMKDDRYPNEGDPDPGPDNPDNPDNPGEGPTVTAEAPINLDQVNEIVTNPDAVSGGADPEYVKCVLKVHSDSGITGFLVEIKSNTLTPAELSQVELSDKLDLVNPGALKDKIAGLGLPVGDQVEGKNDLDFDISGFMELLCLLGEGNHEFILKVTDSKGTVQATLKLHNIQTE